MADITLLTEIPVANELGEGVIWDDEGGSFWWTDIERNRLYRYQLAGADLKCWDTPERLASFALLAPGSHSEALLVAGFESGFAYYHPESGYLHWIAKIAADNPNTRLNDGRADRQQRFWAGGMAEAGAGDQDAGSLYCLDQQLVCTEKFGDIKISNSLCWSPDSTRMYHTDTPSQRIDVYDFEPSTAALSNRRAFVTTEPGCFPDGSTVDAQGYLWNAQWGGSRVVRYAPDGTQDLVLAVPITQPSCVAFGGPQMDILFVTSAWQSLDEPALAEQPSAGNGFLYQTPYRGLPDPRFKPEH